MKRIVDFKRVMRPVNPESLLIKKEMKENLDNNPCNKCQLSNSVSDLMQDFCHYACKATVDMPIWALRAHVRYYAMTRGIKPELV